MNYTIDCSTLKERMDRGTVVIDVMTPEDYAACHLAGAKNACIYEMVFPERIAEYVPDLNSELVVYDATGTKLAAELARERLNQAGYDNVAILKGGLSAWRAEGRPVETGSQGSVAAVALQDGTYLIDIDKSSFEWIGRNLNNRHYGRIAVQKGELVISGGIPTLGTIVLDMNSITNLDIQDPAWNELLTRHLKSLDFFAVERFPTAMFRLTDWEVQDGGAPDALHGNAAGELTIREICRPVCFPAIVAPQADGTVKAHATFNIDRTLWNVCYGSEKMFERLGMHLVHDMITLELFVLARR